MVDWEVVQFGLAVVGALAGTLALLVHGRAPARDNHDDDKEAEEPQVQTGIRVVFHGSWIGVVSITSLESVAAGGL